MDPVSIIGIATTAFKGLKAAVNAGREIQDCMGQLSQWAGAIADLDKSEELLQKQKKNPFRSLIPANQKSIEEQALHTWNAKQTSMKQRDELREMVLTTLGRPAWEDFLSIEAEIRKQRQEALYAEIDRRAKVKEMAVGLGVMVLALATAGLFIWLAIAINGSK